MIVASLHSSQAVAHGPRIRICQTLAILCITHKELVSAVPLEDYPKDTGHENVGRDRAKSCIWTVASSPEQVSVDNKMDPSL